MDGEAPHDPDDHESGPDRRQRSRRRHPTRPSPAALPGGRPMTTTAFVLTGGGSLGAVQVGMLQALSVHGVRPDLLVGTSSGAMNAAWVAGHGMSTDSLAELASIWTGLRRTDVFPVGPRQVLRGLLGLSTAVSTNTRLSRLVAARTGIHELTEAQVPVHLVAADLLSGRDVLISAGPVVTAVLASAAVPGVLPPGRARRSSPRRRCGRAPHRGQPGHRPRRHPCLRPADRLPVCPAETTRVRHRRRAAGAQPPAPATPCARGRRPAGCSHHQGAPAAVSAGCVGR